MVLLDARGKVSVTLFNELTWCVLGEWGALGLVEGLSEVLGVEKLDDLSVPVDPNRAVVDFGDCWAAVKRRLIVEESMGAQIDSPTACVVGCSPSPSSPNWCRS